MFATFSSKHGGMDKKVGPLNTTKMLQKMMLQGEEGIGNLSK